MHDKILLVDDDPALLIITRRVLENAGYQVETAGDGETALRLVRGCHPDLVLLDVNMPGMDGFEVCRRIKSDPDLKSVLVMILSAMAVDSASKVQGLSLGADGYIERPIANRELLARVRVMLRIHEAEHDLQISLDQWQATFDAVRDAIFLSAPDFTILRCNKTAAQLFGLPVEKIIGRKCHELVHGENQIFWLCPLLKTGDIRECKTLLVEHKKRWLQATIDPVTNAAGEFMGTVHVLTNVTEQKLAEEKLRESEESYRVLFESESDAILLIDNASGAILRANPAAEILYGYTQAELLTMKNADLSAEPEQTQRVTKNTAPLPNNVIAIPLRYHHRKDGSTFPVEITGRFFIYDGRSVHIAAIRDITQRQKDEESIKTALAEKETLLRELYHRTKNNMQVISAMLSLQMNYTNDPVVDNILTDMNNRIQSMAMVHQKLYQARNLSSIDLGEYLSELTGLLEHSYRINLGVFVTLDLQDFPVQIDLAIPCGLVLNELVSNALKYAFPAGRSGELKVSLRKDAAGTIFLSVSDDGIGLPPDFNPRKDGRLGMQTLITLVEQQLQGQIEFINGPGLTVLMQFKENQD